LIAGLVGENKKFAAVVGSAVATVMVRDEVEVCPMSLVAVKVIVIVPPRAYRCVAVMPVPVALSPKSHANVPLATPLFTLDEEALKEMSQSNTSSADAPTGVAATNVTRPMTVSQTTEKTRAEQRDRPVRR
jgi:hypothetical protein